MGEVGQAVFCARHDARMIPDAEFDAAEFEIRTTLDGRKDVTIINVSRATERMVLEAIAEEDDALLEKFLSATLVDLSSGILDKDVSSAFVAAMRVSGGAPKAMHVYLHTNTLLGPAFVNGLLRPEVSAALQRDELPRHKKKKTR